MTLTLSADAIRPVAGLFRRLKIKTTLPILDHVRLTVTEGETEAVLETTDLDIHLAVRLPIAGPTTPGAFTIPRSELFAIARFADKGGLVRFDADEPADEDTERKVSVIFSSKTLRSDRVVTGLDPTEFPPAPTIEGQRVIFPTATLDAIRRVRPATSTDDTRYVLKGVFLTGGHGGAVVATDGRRLATVATRVPCSDGILPNAVADLLVDPACQTAAVWCGNESAASLTFGKTRLSFRMIEGNFPNYQQVIPQGFTSSATLPAAIVPAVISWLRPHGKETVNLTFHADHHVHIAVSPKEGPTAETTVPCLVTGPAPRISFNAAFLTDALTMDLHTIDMIDEMSPGVLTDGPTRYVLMPMRLTGTPVAEPAAEDGTDGTDGTDGDETADDADDADAPTDEDPADFHPGDAPELFVEAYYDTLDGLDPDQNEYDRVFAAWQTAGEPEDIATFILFRAAKPEPQDELPAAPDKLAKKGRKPKATA